MRAVGKKSSVLTIGAITLFLLTLGAIKPAYATEDVIDFAEIGHIIEENGHLIAIEAQNAGNAAIKAFGDNLQAALGIRNTQAVVDAEDKAALTNNLVQTAGEYSVPVTNKSCYNSLLGQATMGAQQGAQSLAASMGAAADQTSGVTAGQEVASDCLNGYYDTITEYPDVGKVTKCVATDPKQFNRDINYSSMNSDHMMQLPPGITQTGGVIKLPTVTASMSDHQKDFIDGYNMCIKKLPLDPPNAAATKQSKPGLGILAIDAQRRAKLDRSPSFNDCINEVIRNTAIPPGVAATLGGSFPAWAAAQQQECIAMVKVGITDPDLTNCATNGLSQARAEELIINRFASPTYRTTLPQNSKLKPEDIDFIEQINLDTRVIAGELRELINVMHANVANTMPTGGMPALSPLDQSTK